MLVECIKEFVIVNNFCKLVEEVKYLKYEDVFWKCVEKGMNL